MLPSARQPVNHQYVNHQYARLNCIHSNVLRLVLFYVFFAPRFSCAEPRCYGLAVWLSGDGQTVSRDVDVSSDSQTVRCAAAAAGGENPEMGAGG